MSGDAPETVEGSATELPSEAQEAIADFLPEPSGLMDPTDRHEVAVVLDEHDVAMLVRRAQGAALEKWVYKLPDGSMGLSVFGVQDTTAQMNWTGKARIGVLPETSTVEQLTADVGNGPEPFWVATIFARDENTGLTYSGTSMEPHFMLLKEKTAVAWRRKGKKVPADNRVFDVFARTKAMNKAERNALDKFIPTELKETIIAMVAKDSSRVERVQTEGEKQAETAEPMLTDDRAKELMASCEAIYAEVRELGGGQGKVRFPPTQFQAWLMRSWHDHDALERFKTYLEGQRDELPGVFQREAEEREAAASCLDIPCPVCRQGPSWRCAQVNRAGEVEKDEKDKPKLINQPHVERYEARLAAIRGGQQG